MKFFVNDEGLLYKVILKKNDKNIVIPEGVTGIGNDVFNAYLHRQRKILENISNIEFPESLKVIGNNCFLGCKGLKKVVIPDGVDEIGESAFEGCISIETVKLPKNIGSIRDNLFSGCEKLSNISFPINLSTIGQYAFLGCKSLKEINLPDSIEILGTGSFQKCYSLEKVYLSKSLTFIPYICFGDCKKLKKINIPDRVEFIGEFAFSGCENLKKVAFPNTLKSIKRQAFSSCKELKNVIFPKSLKVIESTAFYQCENLESVQFYDFVSSINRSAFEYCKSLKKIVLPKCLLYVGDSSFAYCDSLQEIVIPDMVKSIDRDAFLNCDNLKSITLQNIFNLNEKCIQRLKGYKYYYNSEKKEVLVAKEGYPVKENYKPIDVYINCFDNEYSNWYIAAIMSIIFDKEKYEDISFVQNDLVRVISEKELNASNCDDVLRDLKSDKEYSHLCKRILNSVDFYSKTERKVMFYDLFELAFSLGAFCEDQVKRQRACEFIYNMFDIDKFSCRTFHYMFESMKLAPYNEEWADFFMSKSNYKQLINLEVENNGFIAKIHNNFNDIKEFGRSNKGKQRYRKVTVDMSGEYFFRSNFNGVDETNVDISKEIRKYVHSQGYFDDACDIRREYLKKRSNNEIDDHILGEELSDILADISGTMENLNCVANNKFSYEFLSKYDPKNFVLGKYCSCCAHLAGFGDGIMKDSILHPDCQNLIIKDENGRIIAKSTLYVNRKKGYGVFNNVEINEKYLGNDDVVNKIYEKYIKAINDFAVRYNELNPSNPLKQINVGMNFNDLDKKLQKNEKKSNIILQGIDFSHYGGDWKGQQYIVWPSKKKK